MHICLLAIFFNLLDQLPLFRLLEDNIPELVGFEQWFVDGGVTLENLLSLIVVVMNKCWCEYATVVKTI